jgi:hypothetical protein
MAHTQETLSSKSEVLIEKENKYGAHNYHPLPVVLDRGKVSMSGMWTERNIMIFYQLILP